MTERSRPSPTGLESDALEGGPGQGERRTSSERPAKPRRSRRSEQESRWARWFGIAGRDIVIILASVSAIIFTISRVHPIFANQPMVAVSLTRAMPATKAVLAPTPVDTSQLAQIIRSPQFARDRAAFAADLVKTGRMPQSRADSIAFYAVREAYRDGIPPAVVFGVMLTENSLFVSSAMSNVGAVGLMQVYPRIWLKALGAKFGRNLAVDSTNVKYGVYILSQYIKSDSGRVTPAAIVAGLLHYNGCVRGTNTSGCHTYPTKVKTYVENQGNFLCGDKSFYECIARPFVAGLFGRTADTTATTQ